jgi:putative DNA primase/helicase
VPWQRGQALSAAIELFSIWQSEQKFSPQGVEHGQILEMVQGFIQAHSEARFSDIQFQIQPGDRAPLPVHNRAGYWREDEIGKRIYMFYPAALKEATRGYPIVRVTEALVKAGALEVGSDGKRSIPTWIPEGTKPRLYHIDPAKLILPEDDEEEEIEAEQKTGT